MNKKRFQRLLLLLIISMVLMACTNRSLVTKQEEAESIGETYGFTMLNVTFDTKEMKEALVSEYQEQTDKTEAIYESKVEQVYLQGDEAMEKLDGIFKALDLTAEMADEDLIKEASKAFEVIDYTRILLKITFKGHDTKALMLTK